MKFYNLLLLIASSTLLAILADQVGKFPMENLLVLSVDQIRYFLKFVLYQYLFQVVYQCLDKFRSLRRYREADTIK